MTVAGIYSVPSEVLSYLAAGRSILASIPHENLATRILKAEAGLVSEPGDDEAMLRNAESLLASPELCARLDGNGRGDAEANFNIERIVRGFDPVLHQSGARAMNPLASSTPAQTGELLMDLGYSQARGQDLQNTLFRAGSEH